MSNIKKSLFILFNKTNYAVQSHYCKFSSDILLFLSKFYLHSYLFTS